MIGTAPLQALLMATVIQSTGAPDNSDETETLTPISVIGQRVANLQPASTYTTLATALRYDPQVNLQTRGMPEGQADVTVRGGLFENTGFRMGAVTVFDPQTGHYSAEAPIDPAMLGSPEILTDFDNGLNAFNASVATVHYGFSSISQGGHFDAGIGTDSLLYASARISGIRNLSNGRQIAGTVSASASRGDGTLDYGDHDFKRFSAHLQSSGENSETNFLLGYHDKFAGWPGMYTGFSSLPETDHSKLGLALLDHFWSNDGGWYEFGAAYRWLDDDYDFDRKTTESGIPGAFEHETRSLSLGLTGQQTAAGLEWYFSGQFSADRLVRSTDLTYGDFNSRSYLSFSLAPGKQWALGSGSILALKAGIRADLSNRDENALMPLFSLSLEQPADTGLNRYGLEFTRTSQLPGYTALNSRPGGLFGGNANLGREYANTLTAAYTHERDNWYAKISGFYRQDSDLVDWTYQQDAPFTRQANAVDIDVTGLEGLVSWHSEQLQIVGGYTWLDKDADYGSAQVDASFYALNYARHRVTLALVYTPVPQIDIRLDNEYRRQQDNLLRSGDSNAYIASLSGSWKLRSNPAVRISLIADNLTDSEFQEFPGTPPMGRQVSLGIGVDW
jgi:vitamin B12 transporter